MSGGLTLARARTIIDGALAKGAELACAPLTVVVLDAGAHVIALNRQDGSSLLRPEIAHGKAAGALGMGFSSRKIGAMAAERPSFVAALSTLAEGALVPAAGGVLIKDAAGELLGAVGISGDTSDRDEACALHGIAAAGLQAGID